MKHIIPRTLLALVITLPGTLDAQERFGSFLDWGTVRIALTPTPHHGVRLSLEPTARANLNEGVGVSGGFAPEAVHEWLSQVRAVTQPAQGPVAPGTALLTPPLVSTDGDSIRVMRSAERERWARQVRILLDGSRAEGRRFDVLAEPRQVEALMAALLREAGFSGWDADSVRASAERSQLDSALVAEVDEPPSVVRTGKAYYPDRRVTGRVILEFVVDTSGRADTTSFRTIFSDDTRLIPWGQVMVQRTRFRPALIRDRPVNVLVRQAVNFNP